jgi:hypothetical protein
LWASYIGDTKFCHIKQPNQSINEASFSVCNG